MMEGYYLFLSAACLLFQIGVVGGIEDMCGDVRKTFSQTASLSHKSYPDYTDRKHCQCNVTVDYSADLFLQLQLHRESFDPGDNSGCSPRLMVAVVDRAMQESSALRDPQVQEIEGILRPSVGVCPMPHAGPSAATRTYVTMRSSQQLTLTFQNPSAHMTRFYVNLSASPAQKLRVTCGSLVIPPPILMEGGAPTPVHRRGSEIGAIVACVIIGVFLIAIFIIAYCKVKHRDRNRSQTATPNRTRKSVTDSKKEPKSGKGNLGYEETPRSSVGDVNKPKPYNLDGPWNHPPNKDGLDTDLIPHDFLRRIASSKPTGNGSPRHVTHYHHEPANVPVRTEQPNILRPTSAIRQPGYPHQPIMDPIFTETPERDPRMQYPRGSRVSFPDQDSFDSPYNKPVPGSPSINAPSDSGYTGSDVHVPGPHPNYDDTTSDISGGLDDRPLTSPDSARPTSQRYGSPVDRTYTPDQLQRYPMSCFPEGTKTGPQRPYPNQTNEYANLGYDPDELDQQPSKLQPQIPIKEYPENPSPLPVKEYPQAPTVIPMKEYPTQSAAPPLKEYPAEPVETLPQKGISPTPNSQQPNNVDAEPPQQAPKKKKKKSPKPVVQAPVKPASPQVPMKAQSPEPVVEEQIAPVHTSPTRGYTPGQFRPISPDPNSPCASPASMISGSRTPMGRSPYPQSPLLIPPLAIDDRPYQPPSPWRMPYYYKQEPLMYIDDTDSESVVSMSNRDLYVRSHKEVTNKDGMNQYGSITPVLRDPYRPSDHRPPAQYRPATISETDV